jgi:septal ring factor EnvC (AmiA/AmiB activator)
VCAKCDIFAESIQVDEQLTKRRAYKVNLQEKRNEQVAALNQEQTRLGNLDQSIAELRSQVSFRAGAIAMLDNLIQEAATAPDLPAEPVVAPAEVPANTPES